MQLSNNGVQSRTVSRKSRADKLFFSQTLYLRSSSILISKVNTTGNYLDSVETIYLLFLKTQEGFVTLNSRRDCVDTSRYGSFGTASFFVGLSTTLLSHAPQSYLLNSFSNFQSLIRDLKLTCY